MDPAASAVRSSKITVPEPAGSTLSRHRLSARLDDFVRGDDPVLLLSAPAGFGKTTLLAEWATGRERGRPVSTSASAGAAAARLGWCTLDSTDSTGFRFWSSLLAALRRVTEPRYGDDRRLAAPRAPADSRFLLGLLEELAAAAPVVLVLDNLQAVTEPTTIHDLDRLVEVLPSGVRLVLATRSDPPLPSLQRLKLSGGLLQLRAHDLAFSLEEVRTLAPDAPDSTVQEVWCATEGWPALVRLCQLSEPGLEPGLGRALGDEALADYLFHEAFRRQRPEVQRALLLCSVPRVIPLDLAARLTDRPDVGRLLRAVGERSGLVTRTTGGADGDSWFRMHPILRTYLRGVLLSQDHEAARRTHAECARWFLGSQHDVEAVAHAMASGDPGVQEQTLATAGMALVSSGESQLLLTTMSAEGGGRAAVGPWAHTVMAAALLELGRPTDAATRLTAARYAAPVSAHLQLTRAATELHLRRRQGVALEPATLTGELPDLPPDLRLFVAVQRGTALLWCGALEEAAGELRTGASLARGLGRDAALIDCLTYLGAVEKGRSRVVEVSRHVEEAIALAEDHGWDSSPRMAYPLMLRGWCAWQQLDQDLASACFRQARAVLDPTSDPTIVMTVEGFGAALDFEDTGSPESAERLHSVCQQFPHRVATPSLVARASLFDARACLALHNAPGVRRVLDVVGARLGRCGEHRIVAALLEECQGRLRRARALLDEVGTTVPSTVPSSDIDARALAARLALRDGDPYAAVTHTRRALELAGGLGCLKPVVDAGGAEVLELLRTERGRWGVLEELVTTILARTCDVPAIPATLTARELEVVRELPTLRTLEEIAGSMFVSVNTVKTHLRGAYRKLGAGSRREAVDAARRAGII